MFLVESANIFLNYLWIKSRHERNGCNPLGISKSGFKNFATLFVKS